MNIEKGIDLPPKGVRKHSPYAATAGKMQVGDSVLCANQKEANSLIAALWRTKLGHAQRKVEGGIRVWCIAKK